MKLLDQVNDILSQNPLPSDAPRRIDALLEEASGREAELIEFAYEALYAAATEAQLKEWSL